MPDFSQGRQQLPSMMKLFQYGISWDPREPLPDEFTSEEVFENVNGHHNPSDPPGPPVWARQAHRQVGINHIAMSTPPARPPQAPSVPASEVRNQATINVLGPLSVTVKGSIIHDMASVSVIQMFESPATEAIAEARYTFPLPNNCTVTEFNCRFGAESVLQGKVKARQEAKEKFDKAVRDRRSTALLEQVTTEVFTASLGNIPANTRLKTQITYLTNLKTEFVAEKTIFSFLMPTAIGPRYGNAPAAAGSSTPTPNAISVEFEIHEIENAIIKCATHLVTVETHDKPGQASSLDDLIGNNNCSAFKIARVQLSKKEGFHEQDMVLSITREPSKHQPTCQGWGEQHSCLDNQMALMIDVPRSGLPVPSRSSDHGEVIFLADRSGSMHTKIPALKSALRFFLKGIPLGWFFNLWSFGTSFEHLWSESRQYSPESLEEALNHLEHDLIANLGGTELLRATEALIESRARTGPCEIIILTDGEVWRLEETLDYVRKARVLSQGALRFFALGIGNHVSAALVDGIARYGGGYSDIVQGHANEGWEDHVVKMLDGALSTRTDCDISLDLGNDHQIEYQSPRDLTIINTPFQSSKMFVLFSSNSNANKPSKVTLNIKTDSSREDSTSLVIPLAWDRFEDNMVHALAARACLDEITMRQGNTKTSSHPSRSRLDLEKIKSESQEAETLACRYSLLSKWTSLFLEHEKATGQLHGFSGDAEETIEQSNKLSALLNVRKSLSASITGASPAARRHRQRLASPASFAGVQAYPQSRHCSIPIQNSKSSPCSSPDSSDSSDSSYDDHDCLRGAVSRPRTSAYHRLSQMEMAGQSSEALPKFIPPQSHELFGSSRLHASHIGLTKPESAQCGFVLNSSAAEFRSGKLSGSLDNNFVEKPEQDSKSKQVSNRVPDNHRDFIIGILNNQRYDGSIDDKVIDILGNGAEKTFNKISVYLADHGLEKTGIRTRDVAMAIVTIVVLHEDYADMANLWKLIVSKARAFVEGEVGGLLDYERMKDQASKLLRECIEQDNMDSVETRPEIKDRRKEVEEVPCKPEWTELDTAPF